MPWSQAGFADHGPGDWKFQCGVGLEKGEDKEELALFTFAAEAPAKREALLFPLWTGCSFCCSSC